MLSKNWGVRSLAFCLTLAFLAAGAQLTVPSARAEDPMGMLTVTGMVKLNGKPAATGDIVVSGGTVETAAKSSAVVSLGKLGRVEALPETRMHVRWTDTNISIVVDMGSVRVDTGDGVTATITRGT
jgi:hypothetical protein